VTWGYNGSGQLNQPALPAGVIYTHIEAGLYSSIARRSDGKVVTWGNAPQPILAPDLASGFTYSAIDAGGGVAATVYGPGPLSGSVSDVCWPPAPNAVNPGGAEFRASGCAGLTGNSLQFDVTGLPPGGAGLFFYGRGDQQIQVPFGNGWLCVGGSLVRIPPVLPVSAGGTVSLAIDLTSPTFSTGPNVVTPASTWIAQFWYRDVGSGPSTSNLSNGQHLTIVP
jgi:hypothetical protein